MNLAAVGRFRWGGSLLRLVLLSGCACCLLLVASSHPVVAQTGDAVVVGSTEELFELLRKQDVPVANGLSIEDALAAHLRGGEIDEGSYPPSDLWEQQFVARRTEPERLSYSGRVVGKYSRDDVSGVRKWEKELEVNLQQGDYSGYIRLTDLNNFAYNNDPFRLKKLRFRYSGDDWRVTVGSVGAVFGRGLALNMFEDRFLEFDNEVNGIRVDTSLGKSDVTLLAGRNKNPLDARHSTVSGLRWHSAVTKHLELGAHYVNVEFPDATFAPATPNVNSLHAYGGDATVRSGRFTGYAEAVQVQRPKQPWANDQFQIDGSDGKGLYVNATYTGPGYALIGEFKDYRRMLTPFGVPPPVRRWQEKSQSYANDDKGYNFQLILTPGEDAGSWQFSYGQDNGRELARPYSEGLVSYSSPTSEGGFGYVVEALTVFDEIQTIESTKLTLNQQLNDDWTSSAVIQNKHHDPSFNEGYTYFLWEGELAYKSAFNVIFARERSSQEGAAQRTWELWEVKFKPSDEQELNLVHGKRREGYVCSGGVCRLEPAFEGTKVEYLLRF